MEKNSANFKEKIFTVCDCKDVLPSINQIVLANVKFVRDWPVCLGGLKITYKQILVKRIKSIHNSKGWQWSGVDSDSFINGTIVSWSYNFK